MNIKKIMILNIALTLAVPLMASEASDADKKKQVSRVYTEQEQKTINDLENAVKNLAPWGTKKALLESAIKNGMNLEKDVLGWWNPLYEALILNDEFFAVYLIKHGADVNRTRGNCLEYIHSLPLAKLAIEKGAHVKDALLYYSVIAQPKLALFYFKQGANPAAIDWAGYTALTTLILEQRGNPEQRIQAVRNFIALGVPLNARITHGTHFGCDYAQLLENLRYTEDQKQRMRGAIDEARQKKGQLHAERQAGLPRELAHHLRHGPKDIEQLILSYDDPSYPIGLEDEFDAVEAEANLSIQNAVLDKSDSKSNAH